MKYWKKEQIGTPIQCDKFPTQYFRTGGIGNGVGISCKCGNIITSAYWNGAVLEVHEKRTPEHSSSEHNYILYYYNEYTYDEEVDGQMIRHCSEMDVTRARNAALNGQPTSSSTPGPDMTFFLPGSHSKKKSSTTGSSSTNLINIDGGDLLKKGAVGGAKLVGKGVGAAVVGSAKLVGKGIDAAKEAHAERLAKSAAALDSLYPIFSDIYNKDLSNAQIEAAKISEMPMPSADNWLEEQAYAVNNLKKSFKSKELSKALNSDLYDDLTWSDEDKLEEYVPFKDPGKMIQSAWRNRALSLYSYAEEHFGNESFFLRLQNATHHSKNRSFCKYLVFGSLSVSAFCSLFGVWLLDEKNIKPLENIDFIQDLSLSDAGMLILKATVVFVLLLVILVPVFIIALKQKDVAFFELFKDYGDIEYKEGLSEKELIIYLAENQISESDTENDNNEEGEEDDDDNDEEDDDDNDEEDDDDNDEEDDDK